MEPPTNMISTDFLQLPDFPTYFTIETVKACNSRCVFCSIDAWPTHTPFMDDALFGKIVDEIALHYESVKQVCLNGSGEPLLDRKIAERVKMMKDRHIAHVILTTNASLLDDKKTSALLEAGLDELMISFNGLDKAKYETMRVGLSFDTVMDNCLRFIKQRDAIGSATRIRMRMESHPVFSDADIAEWLVFWRSRLSSDDQVYAKQLHNWGNQLDSLASASESDKSCHVLWSTMNILSDGSVALCCVDFEPKYPLGSVADDTIEAVWHSTHANRIRHLHATGMKNSVPLCKNCDVWGDDRKIEKSTDVPRKS